MCVTDSDSSKLCTIILTIFVGNQTTEEGFDYYTAVGFPIFATIPAYSKHYTLSVNIYPDRILEDNELFYITPNPQHRPAGEPDCPISVIIRDDDGNFSYNNCTNTV